VGIFGDFNDAAFQYLLSAEMQHKCKFEFSIIRNPLANIGTSGISGSVSVARTIVSAAGLAADVVISKFFLQSITFPTGVSFETERINNITYIKGLVYPESVSMTFIDVEAGLTRRYLTEWMKNIVKPYESPNLLQSLNPFKGLIGSSSYDPQEGSYVFEDNIKAAKRDAILILKPKDNSFPVYPRFMFYGLLPKGSPTLTIGQDEQDIIKYEQEFTVDDIKTPLGI
jgi:hypothetical protein